MYKTTVGVYSPNQVVGDIVAPNSMKDQWDSSQWLLSSL